MPEENVELYRRAVEAYNARDIEAFIALCDPSIEGQSVLRRSAAPSTTGTTGCGDSLETSRTNGEMRPAWSPRRTSDLGGNVLAFHLLHGRGKQSGAEVAMPFAQVVRWRDGLIVYFKGYANRDDALRDLGVAEDALEPIAP